jgi:hypothetical protein
MDVQHWHADRRALQAAQARYDAAMPQEEFDELISALDAALDDLRELRQRLLASNNDTATRERVAQEARDVASYLAEVVA